MTETEIFKAIESNYGSGALMAFADLIESENMTTNQKPNPTPENGEWWMCNRGGVNVVFLRLYDEWRGDSNDSYSYDRVEPICKMVEDKPTSAAALEQPKQEFEQPKHTKVEFEKIGFHKCHEAMFKHEMEDTLYVSWGDGFKMATLCSVASSWESGLYRKVTRELEWWEEAADVVIDSRDSSIKPFFDDGEFVVEASMTKDKWIEFAKALLKLQKEG